ncbi:D-erythronate dehydrogenase [Carnimonas sp. R-84981]|uniref:D-erythronate dehydrogenase n=1 Tax=Carnimonas bestiolae TaxID=3402172 RepID=UPI003EDC416C
MNIVVTGGAGFLGRRLIQALLEASDKGVIPPLDRIVSVDLVACSLDDTRVQSITGDIADPEFARSVINRDTIAVYHMAAALSGQSEAEFDTGMRINLDGTRALLEAARDTGTSPRFIFTSSLAVFGGTMPEVVPETLALMPQSSYGAEKALGEILVNDYSRKGFIDGLVCRLPTIVVRPGKPNSAASSFASGIIREPVAGQPSNAPVPLDTRMWLSSPDAAVANLAHAITLKASSLGIWRVLNLPGLCVTVNEMLNGLERVVGREARALVSNDIEQRVVDIVCSWPGDFDVVRPLGLGFSADAHIDDVIRQYVNEFGPGA